MADWKTVARREGWTVFARSVRVRLVGRKHTVQVREVGDELKLYAEIPKPDAHDLSRLLVANRFLGLAYWHVVDGHACAMSWCPLLASSEEMVIYFTETAALAGRFEMQRNEVDS